MHVAIQPSPGMSQTTGFSLAGLQCVLHSNSLELNDAFSSMGTVNDQSQPAFTFHVDVRPDIRRGNAELTHFRGSGHLVLAMFGDSEMFVFDLLRGEVQAVVAKSTSEDIGFWRHTILPMTLGVLGLTRGVMPLHSACLVRDDRGFLLAGESGAGKSTLAVALAQRGWALLSDDWTYLTLESKLSARGISVPVKLLPDASELFPELRSHTPHRSLNGELAYEVPASELGIEFASQCTPYRLIFVERNHAGRTRLDKCDPDFTMSFFLRWAERLPAEFAEPADALRMQMISRVASLDCWKLSYSGSPAVGAAAIDDLGGL